MLQKKIGLVAGEQWKAAGAEGICGLSGGKD